MKRRKAPTSSSEELAWLRAQGSPPLRSRENLLELSFDESRIEAERGALDDLEAALSQTKAALEEGVKTGRRFLESSSGQKVARGRAEGGPQARGGRWLAPGDREVSSPLWRHQAFCARLFPQSGRQGWRGRRALECLTWARSFYTWCFPAGSRAGLGKTSLGNTPGDVGVAYHTDDLDGPSSRVISRFR